MKKESNLLNRKILVLDRHLLELGKNLSSDTKDWKDLRIKHKQEVQLVGLSVFPNWRQHYQDIAQLAAYHTKKATALKLKQAGEITILDKLLEVESVN